METDRNQTTAQGSAFTTTHWSAVVLAGQGESAAAEAALEMLCRTYWYPLYAYVRRQGHDAHEAQDLTQEFFTRLLENRKLRLASPDRGRFRSFLLSSLKHFLINEWVRRRARKRGGGHQIFSLDDENAERIYRQEPVSSLSPECFFDRRWAVSLLERAVERLGNDYAAAGKLQVFDELRPLLLAENSAESCRRSARNLSMSEGAVKVALHRLRQRFREAVRDEVGKTVADPAEVDEELRCLMAALRS